jgi:hypothetical protein
MAGVRVARAEHLSEAHRRAIRDANRRFATTNIGSAQLVNGVALPEVAQTQRPKLKRSAPKGPGRPSLCDEMEEEMIRRGRRGGMAKSLAVEVRALLEIRKEHPDIKSGKKKLPDEGTARNHLRETYNALKANPDAQF